MSVASGAQGDDRVPRIAGDCDPTRLEITPAEGYLLSRVDGSTPWSLLREIGGMPPEEVDRILEEWLRTGVLEVDGEKEAIPVNPGAEPLPEARIDARLDIPVEVQRQILAW